MLDERHALSVGIAGSLKPKKHSQLYVLSSLAIVTLLQQFGKVHGSAENIFPLYGDSLADGVTRKGEGAKQRDWDKVTPNNFFYDWSEVLVNVEKDKRGNQCEDQHLDPDEFQYDERHQQSPIILTEDPYSSDFCRDTHGFRRIEKGSCTKKQVKLRTQPYGLIAEYRNCDILPVLDFSQNPDFWNLRYLYIKAPAEHKLQNPNGEVQSFPAELQIAHAGTADHNDNIGIVSVFLQVNPTYPYWKHTELEKYISKWEKLQKKQYKKCNVKYDDNDCSLIAAGAAATTTTTTTTTTTSTTSTTTPFSTTTSYCDYSCCNRFLEEEIVQEEKTRKSREQEEKRIQEMNDMEETITNMHEELEELKHQGRNCNEGQNSTDLANEERSLQKTCDADKFCPNNFWRDTNSFYYKYRGSLTNPPCTPNVRWRVMKKPVLISSGQLHRIEMLIAKHINKNCELATVGKRRSADSCKVDVNREVQFMSDDHQTEDCEGKFSLDGFKFRPPSNSTNTTSSTFPPKKRRGNGRG